MAVTKKKLIRKLKNRYRLIIYNDASYQNVLSFKLTRLGVFTVVFLSALFLISAVTLIIAYTPLKEMIPGYPSGKMRRQIIHSAILTDSLEQQLAIRDEFISNFQSLINGEIPVEPEEAFDTAIRLSQIEFKNYNHDSVFHDKIIEEKLNLSLFGDASTNQNLNEIHFFTPLRGIIVSQFKVAANHFGIDVAGSENQRVSAVLDGTVVFSGWTTDAGYVIQIQHSNDLVSAYKHNSELLKTQGEKVKAGEAIAILGNSGELTTGYHLHFELWHKGVALDPENYIDF